MEMEQYIKERLRESDIERRYYFDGFGYSEMSCTQNIIK